MKSNVSTISPSGVGPQLRHLARLVASSGSNGVSKIWTGFSNLYTSLQVGRMEAVLRDLSDEQLSQIGVKRSGIRRHAENLVGL